MARYVALFILLFALAACGAPATPTPDAVATQVAVGRAAAATLTAEVPAATAPLPTQAPAATATSAPTAAPTEPETDTPAPTATQPSPTASPTEVPRDLPTEPPIGPVLGPFAVAGVAGDDVLNVRSGPGVGYDVVGTIPYYGLDVSVRAGGQEVDGSWWVPVEYGDVSGWVNNAYLARQVGTTGEAIAARAAQAILALRDRDMQALAALVHPADGVRFSPYGYVRAGAGAPAGRDLVFSAAEVASLWSDPTVYDWGSAAGSGEPITLTFADYYDEYVYDVDFAQPDAIGFGVTIGQGNTIDNIDEVYPDGFMVEYHFEGFDPQYAGFDWRSLRLVLEEAGGTWYLAGIVHD
ncbi:MAG: SH3 domain-containing protein, partial [Anaerolineae bacterium]